MTWKTWGAYSVHRDGRVVGPSGRCVVGTRNSKGYLQTTGVDKKKLLLHRIVAAAWHGGVTRDMEVDHVDGCKTHNAPSNLRVLTRVAHREADAARQRAQLLGRVPSDAPASSR